MGLLIFPILIAILYFVMIRPQQKRQAQQRELLASLEVGDEVLTAAGIYGVITEFDGPTVFLEVADGVQIKATRESIAALVDYDEDADLEVD